MQPSTWDPDAAPYPVAVVDAKGERILLTCVTLTTPVTPEVLANTRLIAAAPELLEALREIADYSPGSTVQPVLIARAAIAKAEGK